MAQMSAYDDLKIAKIDSEEKDSKFIPSHYDLQTYPVDLTLEDLYQKWQDGDIIIPKFQRGFIWNVKQASRLIELIIMDFPTYPIFMYDQDDDKDLVIDGIQRLESIFSFFRGYFEDDSGNHSAFKLEINPQSPLYHETYESLDEMDKRKFKNYVLRTIMIKQLGPKNKHAGLHHIFERMNDKFTTLQDQEIRNNIYAGNLNKLLLNLNGYDSWRRLLGTPKIDSRQKDVDLILRYMSLFHNHKTYQKPMRDFLFQFMDEHKNSTVEFLITESERFKKTCDVVLEKLGEKPFHCSHALISPIFDSVFVAFASHYDDCPNDIKERFSNLLNDKKFKELTSLHTTNVDTVNARLRLAETRIFE